MTLSKEVFLSQYGECIRETCQAHDRPCPTWQHLPAGHMYYSQYTLGEPITPESAAERFLSQTSWTQGGKG